MAILVMGVGIVSVMSLFPIAYLRAVQGTQLTNATILKMRADSVVDMFGLVGDQFIPQPIEGDTTRCLIDPLAWQDVAANLDGGTAPFINANLYGVDGTLARRTYTPSNSPVLGGNVRQPTRFINVAGILVRDQWPMPLRRLGFGAGAPPTLAGGVPYSFASTAFFGTRQAALNAVALPDTFKTHLTAVPLSLNAARTQVTFDIANNIVDPADLTAINGILLSGIPLRLTLVDATGKRSVLRTITAAAAVNPAAGTITWAAPLPPTFNFATLTEVRVESADPRYTWMLTVRKQGISGGSVTEIDCVVFFNRATEDPEEELVHPAEIPLAKNDPLFSVIPPEDAPYAGVIRFTPYPSMQDPPLREGGYVFDPTNAEWYRVQDIITEDAAAAVIRLDRRPEQFIPFLTIPRSVVHVYPMKTRVDEGQRFK